MASTPPAKTAGMILEGPAEVTPEHIDNAYVEKRRFFHPGLLDANKRLKRRLTSLPIPITEDGKSNDTSNRNIIIPLARLVLFLEHNFCCKKCHKGFQESEEERGAPSLGLEVFGVAFGLNFKCVCGSEDSLRPELVKSAVDKIKTLKNGCAYGTRVNAGDFVLNRRLLLGLQLCGDGRTEGHIIAGTFF